MLICEEHRLYRESDAVDDENEGRLQRVELITHPFVPQHLPGTQRLLQRQRHFLHIARHPGSQKIRVIDTPSAEVDVYIAASDSINNAMTADISRSIGVHSDPAHVPLPQSSVSTNVLPSSPIMTPPSDPAPLIPTPTPSVLVRPLLHNQTPRNEEDVIVIDDDAAAAEEMDSSPILFIYRSTCLWQIGITEDDSSRTGAKQWFNDTLIDFALRYWFDQVLTPDVRRQTHVFSTLFFTSLQKGRECPESLTAARRHLRRVDVFTKVYHIVPIHDHNHWYLAIVTHPALCVNPFDCDDSSTVERQEVYPTHTRYQRGHGPTAWLTIVSDGCARIINRPVIWILDSLWPQSRRRLLPLQELCRKGASRNHARKERPDPPRLSVRTPRKVLTSHPVSAHQTWKSEPARLNGGYNDPAKLLNDFFHQEMLARGHDAANLVPYSSYELRVPQQPNSYDCGPFLVHFAKMFMQRRDSIVNQPTVSLSEDDWEADDVPMIRHSIQIVIDQLAS